MSGTDAAARIARPLTSCTNDTTARWSRCQPAASGISARADPLVAPSPLSAWRELVFGTHVNNPTEEATVWGDDADPDQDGISNLAEYMLGSFEIHDH